MRTIAGPRFPLLSATFSAHSDYSATLSLTLNGPSMSATIIHDSVAGMASRELLGEGDEDATFDVQDKESIVILVRKDSDVVACAILQVDLALIEEIGDLLIPVSVHNMTLDQIEDIMDVTTTTGDLEEVVAATEVAL